MSVRDREKTDAQYAPEFVPVLSLLWLVRAVEVAGASGALVAVIAWREWALSHYRKKGRGDTSGFAKLTHRRLHSLFGIHPRIFRESLRKLADAGLLEVVRPSANSAYQVRVVPLPGEEHWTFSRLGSPAEARKHPPKTPTRD